MRRIIISNCSTGSRPSNGPSASVIHRSGRRKQAVAASADQADSIAGSGARRCRRDSDTSSVESDSTDSSTGSDSSSSSGESDSSDSSAGSEESGEGDSLGQDEDKDEARKKGHALNQRRYAFCLMSRQAADIADARYLVMAGRFPLGMLETQRLPWRHTGNVKSVVWQHISFNDGYAYCTRTFLDPKLIRAVRGVHLCARVAVEGPVPKDLPLLTARALVIFSAFTPTTEQTHSRHLIFHLVTLLSSVCSLSLYSLHLEPTVTTCRPSARS